VAPQLSNPEVESKMAQDMVPAQVTSESLLVSDSAENDLDIINTNSKKTGQNIIDINCTENGQEVTGPSTDTGFPFFQLPPELRWRVYSKIVPRPTQYGPSKPSALGIYWRKTEAPVSLLLASPALRADMNIYLSGPKKISAIVNDCLRFQSPALSRHVDVDRMKSARNQDPVVIYAQFNGIYDDSTVFLDRVLATIDWAIGFESTGRVEGEHQEIINFSLWWFTHKCRDPSDATEERIGELRGILEDVIPRLRRHPEIEVRCLIKDREMTPVEILERDTSKPVPWFHFYSPPGWTRSPYIDFEDLTRFSSATRAHVKVTQRCLRTCVKSCFPNSYMERVIQDNKEKFSCELALEEELDLFRK
jgi:hypothetical protein